jgi:hypothetical protein
MKKKAKVTKKEGVVKQNYNCTQAELYAICYRAWTNYQANLADFTNLSTIYTQPFGQQKVQKVTAAKQLPDEKAREKEQLSLSVDMENIKFPTIVMWEKLPSYIRKAFAADKVQTMIDAAGGIYLKSANHGNWPNLSEMMDAGIAFITENEAVLLAGGGMPANYKTDFTTQQTAFRNLYNDYKTAQSEVFEIRNTKIKANNEIHDDVMAMMKDGKLIYLKNEAKTKLFTFSWLLHLISGPGTHWRTINVDGGATVTVNNTVVNTEIENTGETDLIYCQPNTNTSCTVAGGGVLLAAGTKDVVAFDGNKVMVTNTHATKKGTFKIRCVKIS